MSENNNSKITEEKTLRDKDFYKQACEYFYYHASQRTTMINYFIAVFGAFIALYGALISTFTLASMLIAVFMGIVSAIFFMIDLRTKFDIKKSENVIKQFERDYEVDKPVKDYPYGVFSNETNTYKYYGYSQRKGKKSEFKKLKKLYKKSLKDPSKQEELEKEILNFIGNDTTVSYKEFYQSLGEKTIIPLSFCIKMLYVLCMAVSTLAFVFALVLLFI